MSWTYRDLKRNAPGVVLIVAMFAMMVPSALYKWTNDASPIRSVEPIHATVKSAQSDHDHTLYLVSLESGSSILVDDDRPHLIGATANMERVTRENGMVFYRFAK
ncbi:MULTISPECIES: hypothetical protein [unclassified Mesorhizobium]|uniref:hypothetical protein n=1 Tax=unclassified Mesorhizobium TaxID=325217 RepID=UPI0003CEABE2|nr:hypothetical protein [Mesorhizobium sp. L103C105A0]ESY02597.1 hypothetical protein X755_03095 [Mesorhizobium sp. LNJC405B00]ESY22711.1 hypothetical protein X750_06235 [Mesorhizobium sp. LNJC394B00]ESZ41275.1 hypothetical protein X732_00180 [Mesorhizobium sp. L2C066B000]ESZ61888.1 hypothetical protein X729_14025 [Mesorhizobium sp. L103C131B0]ESZ64900.1 hypothetical protein X728_06235 [Mesorhizobium sp. L103C120A0]